MEHAAWIMAPDELAWCMRSSSALMRPMLPPERRAWFLSGCFGDASSPTPCWRLDCSEDIVRASCRDLSSSTAHERLCVCYVYYYLTSVQRERDVRACEGREGAEYALEGTNKGPTL